jgi:Tol biopolymer transport system component
MKRFVAASFLFGCFALAAASDNGAAEVEPKNLDRLNTKADEDDPHLSPDGLRLFYAANAAGNWDIMVSTRRAVQDPWPRGAAVSELNTKVDDRSPCLISTNGKYPYYLFFATQKDEMKDANFDIYVSVQQSPKAGFTAPTPVNSVCTPADELHPWVTANGRELYFSRKTKEGWRVYVASRPSGTGVFGEPRLVGLPDHFHHVTLTPDGKTMYVQGPLERGRWGLFRAARTAMGAWGSPEPLDDLNDAEAPSGDRSPSLSRDGTMLYFSSDRAGGKGAFDLWVVPTAQLRKAK